MRKLLVVLALGSFVACNNGTSTEDKVDSAVEEKKDMIDSSAEARKDKIDSSAEAKKDMLDSSAKMMSDTSRNRANKKH
ncbi:MAG: hypothetical protein H0X70_01300 [Segetibacter sp.]|nr:hypothetical protein [Segetibacter sp.]